MNNLPPFFYIKLIIQINLLKIMFIIIHARKKRGMFQDDPTGYAR